MSDEILRQLSRRERQVMEAVYRLGGPTVKEVRGTLPDPPSYSAVRRHLGILVEKGFLRHDQVGPRYVYHPTVERAQARRSALRNLLDTFFDGSPEGVVAALLEAGEPLTTEEKDRLRDLIDRAEEEEAEAEEGR